MRHHVKNVLFSCIIFPCFCGMAFSADLFQDLKKAVEQQGSQKKTEPAKPQSSSGSGIDLEALRSLAGFSQEEEVAIGRQAAGNILGAAPLVKDATLQQYVNRVGRWVAGQSERPELNWHFGVIETSDLNAFAAPGGYIFVTKGLYRTLQNESELAAVLAHEIGHVIKKHHLKILQESRLVDLGGKILAKQAGENEQIKKLIGSGGEIFARSLDKNAEFEADRIGVVLAARAGYDPFGLPTVLQDLGHVAKDDSRISLLFKTHPHPDDRLTQLGEAIGDHFDGIKGLTLESRFYRIKP
jgi:beta-barrel assembly-enhancing protease